MADAGAEVPRLRLLGGFRLTTAAGETVEIPSRRARALLAYVHLAPEQSVGRERLSGLFWSDRAEAQARASLRQCLFELRDCLSNAGLDLLEVSREQVALRRGALSSDVSDLERALLQAAPDAVADLQALISPEPLLDGLELDGLFQDWLDQTRGQFDQNLAARGQDLLERLQKEGRWPEVRVVADALLQRDPLHETMAAAAIRAAAATGDPAGAHRRFQALKAGLAREFGASPGPVATEAIASVTSAAPTPVARAEIPVEPAASPRAQPDPGSPPLERRASVPPGTTRRGAGPERRQITTLFCRPLLPAEADPEDRLLAVDFCRSLCSEVIPRHGGVVARHDETGVLAYFGFPNAREEEGVDGVRAALALREAATAPPPGLAFSPSLQTGLATGVVMVSAANGASAGDSVVLGEAPQLAMRLSAEAAANAILVHESTRRITDGMFAYRSVEGAGAQEVFEVVEATPAASRSQVRARGPVRLFGREAELETLQACWASAVAGSGQVVLIRGEAGIGKTSLVAAFRDRLGPEDAVVTALHCGPAHTARPLQPVIELLEREAGFEIGDLPDLRRRKLSERVSEWRLRQPFALELLSELLRLEPEAAAEPSGGPDADRRRALTIELLLDLFVARSGSAPALLVAEDLHWADPTTLDLLSRLVRRVGEEQWLVVAAARPEFEPDWSDYADVATVLLGPLARADARRICSALDQEERLPEETVQAVIDRADGVPLFVEEVATLLLEAWDDLGDEQASGAVAIPDTLQGSLMARLDRLGPAKEVARTGAAIGRTFSFELIAAVAEQPAAELRQALRDLIKAGLVESVGTPPQSRYTFRHALLCDAAYESLPRRRREALHRRIAGALQARPPEQGGADPGFLAGHLARAGAIVEAIPLWALAGEQAAAKAAHAEAIHHLDAALDHLRAGKRSDPGMELRLLIGLAVSLAAYRGYAAPEVGEKLAEARALCEALGDETQMFAILRGICAFSIVAGDQESAESLAGRCREISLKTGRPEHRIEGECALGYVLWTRGELEPARLHLETSVRLYTEHDGASLPLLTPQDPLVQCLGPLQSLYHALGDDGAAELASQRLVAHARSLAGSFSHAFGVFWRAFHALSRGDLEDALVHADEAVQLCDAYGYQAVAAHAALLQACAAGRLGDPRPAVEAARRALAEIERQGQRTTTGYRLGEFAALQAQAGDAAGALETLDEAIRSAERFDERFWLSPLHLRRAQILAGRPDHDPALVEADLRSAIEIARAQGAPGCVRRAEAVRSAGVPPALEDA